MKSKISLFLVALIIAININAQDFKPVANDVTNESVYGGIDISSVDIALDKNQNKIWFKIHSKKQIPEKFVFEIAIDSNLQEDGSPHYGSANYSLNYDKKVLVMYNKPFNHQSAELLAATPSTPLTTNSIVDLEVGYKHVTVSLELAKIDHDSTFNFVVSSGDDNIHFTDDLPNKGALAITPSLFNEPTIGIDQVKYQKNYQVFYQPEGVLISSLKPINFKVYNLLGNLIESRQSLSQLNTSELKIPNGIYLVSIEDEGFRKTEKILVK